MPADPGFVEFDCNGAAVCARSDGALHWPDEGLLAVADLHLEKGSSYAARRQFLPPYDTRQTLAALARAVAETRPRVVVCLGDTFHDRKAAERLGPDDVAALRALTGTVRDWIWIAGNHDPEPPRAWGGTAAGEVALGPLTFRHEALPGAPAGELSGHFHPVAALTVRGRGLRRRCFATDGARTVLPSFGAYTGGLNVLDPAIGRLFAGEYDALALGAGRVHRLSWRRLRADAALTATPGA